MKKEALQRIMAEYTGNDLAEYICELLEKEKSIKNQVQKLRQDAVNACDEYAKKQKEITDGIKELQLKCPHFEFTQYVDWNCYRECDWCGYTW